MSEKLRGQALLDYCEANAGLPEKELVIGAGFCSEVTDEEGNTRLQVHTKPFYQELAISRGIIDPVSVGRKNKSGKPGKGLTYLLKANPKSGNIVLTGGYTEQIGVKPGEKVSVEIVEEAGELVIKRASEEDQPDDLGSGEATSAQPAMAGAF